MWLPAARQGRAQSCEPWQVLSIGFLMRVQLLHCLLSLSAVVKQTLCMHVAPMMHVLRAAAMKLRASLDLQLAAFVTMRTFLCNPI